MKKDHPITILDQKFVLKTELDDERVRELEELVNGVMNQIKNSAANLSTQNVAILAALNLAENFFSEDVDQVNEPLSAQNMDLGS